MLECSGLSAVRGLGRDGGAFMAGGYLRGCQRLRSDIRFGFHLSGCLRQTLCG